MASVFVLRDKQLQLILPVLLLNATASAFALLDKSIQLILSGSVSAVPRFGVRITRQVSPVNLIGVLFQQFHRLRIRINRQIPPTDLFWVSLQQLHGFRVRIAR
jgi:hypothetical protein